MSESTCVSALLATEGFLLQVTVPLRGMRMLDLLNDPATEYLTMEQFRVYRPGSKSPMRQGANASIRKLNINFCVLDGGKHETEERRRIAYQTKDKYDAFIAVGEYAIEGKIHCKGHIDAIAFMNRQSSSFIPVSHARIVPPKATAAAEGKDTIIINKMSIDLFHLEQVTESEEDVLMSLRQLIAE